MTARRITIVTSELLGRPGTGGAGTADSLLAVALGRSGHDVQLLVASGRAEQGVSPSWQGIYAEAGVDIRRLEPQAGLRPRYLAPAIEVYGALRERPPDLVVADDWRGLAFSALRARQAGVAFGQTAFVIYAHGPGRVLTEFAQKVPDTIDRFGEAVAERCCVELADAVVSPSRWLLDWMHAHEWPPPKQSRVVPYLRQYVALGGNAPNGRAPGPVERVAFFGQLREGKGIRVFISALGALDSSLLAGREILFLGSARGRWVPETIAEAIPAGVKERAGSIRFETDLDRDAALAELEQAGTLAVMPSLLDNAPNTVSECIENRIPFLAAAVGGIPELIAEQDQERVLFAPTVPGLTAALTDALDSAEPFAPAEPAEDPEQALSAWLSLLDELAVSPQPRGRAPVTVAVIATGDAALADALRLADRARDVEVEVIRAESRRSGLFRTSAEWVLFLDDEDTPDDDLVDVLVAAQRASGADIVTTAVRAGEDGVHAFLGNPGSLGLLENQYGVIGLVRASLAIAEPLTDAPVDPDWVLFARLVLGGARIVSLHEDLSLHRGRPGRIADLPGDGLAVLEAFEAADPARLGDLPQLAATLGATLERAPTDRPIVPEESLPRRVRRRLASLTSR